MAQLPDSGQADFATKVPANHRQAGGAAIGFINLLDQGDRADAPLTLAKEPCLVGKRIFAVQFLLLAWALWWLVELDLVGRTGLGRQFFLGKIQWHSGLGCEVVLSPALFHQLGKLRELLVHLLHRVRRQRQ